ncbi:MAG TPA: hypothetical protein VGB97_00930 [Candidatus Paceibacterota bacterium]
MKRLILFEKFHWEGFEMKSKFFENLRTFGPDLVEYAQGWMVWRSGQKAKRSAAGAIAALLKLELRRQTISKIVEAWDPISDAVEPDGFPLPMERDIQAYDAEGNMVDMERLFNESNSLLPSHWSRRPYTRQEIEMALDILAEKYRADIRVEHTFPHGAPAREFRLR